MVGIDKVLRWAGRFVGTIVAGMWLLFMVMMAFFESDPLTGESIILLLLVIFSAISVGIAWRRERLGGILVLACGIGHSLFALLTAGRNQLMAMSVAGIPLVFSGLLFLLARWQEEQLGKSK